MVVLILALHLYTFSRLARGRRTADDWQGRNRGSLVRSFVAKEH